MTSMQQTEQHLTSIADRIKAMQKEVIAGHSGINSARADVISQVMTFMDEHTLPNLLRNATTGEREGYEEIRHDREKVKDWAKMVYNRRFKIWLGRTRKFKNPYTLLDKMKKAREGKTPQALFQWLLKND